MTGRSQSLTHLTKVAVLTAAITPSDESWSQELTLPSHDSTQSETDYSSVLEEYLAADRRLTSPYGEHFSFGDYINPANIATEREKFLMGKITEPRFRYAELPDTIKARRQRILSVDIPDGITELTALYKRYKEKKLTYYNFLESRNDEEKLIQYSEKLFGAPDAELLARAREILRDTKREPEPPKILSAKQAGALFLEAIETSGLPEYKIEYYSGSTVAHRSSSKTLRLPAKRAFSEREVRRLISHEIWVHAFRASNGDNQPLNILRSGLAGYTATEEGLALYTEKVTGTLTANAMRKYAGRVLAVSYARNGASFNETFSKLRKLENGFSAGEAWQLAFRVHRAGGYLRDHVYLQGLFEVEEYVRSGGDIEMLFVGKIGIRDVPYIKAVKRTGIINEPRFIPEVFSSLDSDRSE